MRLFATLFSALLWLGLLALPASATGTIFGLPLSQQFDANGNPLSGAKLYIYTGTTTPADAFGDFGMTEGQELPFPIVADSTGRLPEFWLADGVYRVRLTTSNGVEVFNLNTVQSLGPSSGEGGGGGDPFSDEVVFQTGDPLWVPRSGTRAGWVRMNARTIGSSTSGASERANADTQALYEFIWNNCADTECPVSGGRGGSASADFDANNPIATYDMRGRSPFGVDDMGNGEAGIIADGTTAGETGGSASMTLTETELPEHDHGNGSLSANHSHSDNFGTTAVGDHAHPPKNGGVFVGNSSVDNWSSGIGPTKWRVDATTGGAGAHGHTVTGHVISAAVGVVGRTASTGSGTAFSLMNPYRLGTWYIKL